MKTVGIIAGVVTLALIAWLVFGTWQQAQPPTIKEGDTKTYRLSVDETDPYKGSRNAPVTVIAVGSFTCAACKSQARALDQLLAQYPQEVKIVWKDLPDSEEYSLQAAIAARCAQQQGRFWEYHDKLFLKQDILADSSFLIPWAADVGLATDVFTRCLASHDARDLVIASANEVLRTTITQIPFIQINEESVMQGYQAFPILKEAVELLHTQ